MRRRCTREPTPRSGFAGFRFPPDVIILAVRWYLRYGLSYRDVEELLAERGIAVDHVTIYRWVQRFTPLLINAARPCRHTPGDHPRLRARPGPAEVITDKAAVYSPVLEGLVAGTWHHSERYANNPVEADHGRLKSRLRPMRGLKRLRSARVISAGHAFVQNIRRGHYELGTEETVNLRVLAAFDELTLAI